MMPLTPRAPTSDDPYGLGLFSNKKNKDDQEINMNESSIQLNSAEPIKINKGKANFLNRIKKSAGHGKVKDIDENTSPEKVNEFKIEDEVLNSPEKPEKENPIAKKKPKIVIQINNEEEINALKEELDLVQMQFDEEEDEFSKEEWKKEIERVKEAILKKQTMAQAEQADQKEVEGADSSNDGLSRSNLAVQTDNSTHPISPTSDINSNMRDDVDSKGGDAQQEKPKKKGIIVCNSDAFGSMMSRLKNKSKH